MFIGDTIQAQNADRRFIRGAMSRPILSREREQELALRWRGQADTVALHELIGAHMRLVISIANRFRRYGLPLGDLVQEGNIGLMQAAVRFEPQREIRFSTYATWWIRSSVQDHVLRNWSIVRTGSTVTQRSLFFNLLRLRARIKASGSYPPNEVRRRIAERMQVDLAEVERMEVRLAANDISLNAPAGGEDDGELLDRLADDAPDPESVVLDRDDEELRGRWIAEAVANLSEREQTIITDRHLKEKATTLESLGQRLGISKERVRQVEYQAMRKLRVLLEGRREAII